MNNPTYLNLDIRSLNTFLIIMETGSFTAAANQLNVTQSAVSHSLERLRMIFKDELFMRSGRTIKPTPRALQLAEELKPLLANIRTLTEATEFDPAAASITWTVAANDLQRDLLLPGFYQRVVKQVQHFTLNIIPSELPAADLLRDNAVHLAISPIPPNATDIIQKRLFSTYSSCFYDANCREAPTSEEDFKQANYISMTFMAGKNMSANGHPLMRVIEEKIQVRVSNFAGLASFLKGSELLAIAPREIEKNILAGFSHTSLPYIPPQVNMYMLWHQRYQNDATHQWLREQLQAVCLLQNT